MTDRRRGLGRGLGALIPSGPAVERGGERPVDVFFPGRTATLVRDGEPTSGVQRLTEQPAAGDLPRGAPPRADLVAVPGAWFAEIPVDAIRTNPRQPRQFFDEDELAELAQSVREVGVLQPVVVRARADEIPAGEPAEDGNRDREGPGFELVMGERRWRAARAAGLATVPAIVRDTSDEALLRDALLENLHRSQLNPLEEAAAYQQLLADFGCTHDDLAARLGRSRPQISNTVRLLRLPPLVQRRVAAGVLSAGHARALLGLDDPAGVERLAQRVVAEGLSVRAVEELVAMTSATSGAAVEAPRARRPVTRPDPDLAALAGRLGDRLDTRVGIVMGRRKGKLTVEFAGVSDLHRILAVLAPDT